jgi:hypothetical protein
VVGEIHREDLVLRIRCLKKLSGRFTHFADLNGYTFADI